MNTSLFIFALLALQAICWWVGRRASQGVSNNEDYYLDGRRVSFFPLMMTFIATQVGGGIVLGSAEEATRLGGWVLLYPLGQVCGLLGLGLGIGKLLSRYRVSTVAQIFEAAYGSSGMKKFASFLSIVSLFLILVAQVVASKRFMLSIGVDEPWLFLGFWIILIAYTAMGGMRAVIATDIIQSLFFIGVFILAFSVGVWNGPGLDWSSSLGSGMPTDKLTGWLFMPFLFTFIEQDMGQRCFAARSPGILSRSTLAAAGITFCMALIPIYFGLIGAQLGVDPKGALLSTAVLVTNPWVASLVACAVLAAILSTADSLINAIGSNLSTDFMASSKKSLNRTRWLSISIGVFAMAAAPFFDNIVDLLIQSYDLSVACLFVPLMGALFSQTHRYKAALSGVFCGGIGFILFRLIDIPLPRELAAVALSGVGYVAAWILESKQEATT